MNITKFVQGRGVDRNAVSMYIKRHPELFENHTKSVGKTVELDEVAIRFLEEKYPLEKPVQIIYGVDQEEYDRVRRKLEFMQDKMQSMSEELLKKSELVAQAETKTILLEDRERQIEELKEEKRKADQKTEDAEKELSKFSKTFFGLYRKENGKGE